MKLSKREKILLVVLAVLILIFVGWRFLIGPALEKKAALESTVENLSFQKEQMNAVLASEGEIRQALADAYKAMDTEEYFYRNLSVSEVDRMISQYAADAGVTLNALVISTAQTSELMRYQPQPSVLFSTLREQRLKFDEAAQKNFAADTEGISGSDDTTAISIPVFVCQAEVNGKTANVVAMVDAINKTGRSIYVTATGSGLDNIEAGVYRDTVTINVYFLED